MFSTFSGLRITGLILCVLIYVCTVFSDKFIIKANIPNTGVEYDHVKSLPKCIKHYYMYNLSWRYKNSDMH